MTPQQVGVVSGQKVGEECSVLDNPMEQPSLRGDLPSVDDWWVGPASCPVQTKEIGWFDPIATVEVPIAQGDQATPSLQTNEGIHAGLVSNQGKRPRGRP